MHILLLLFLVVGVACADQSAWLRLQEAVRAGDPTAAGTLGERFMNDVPQADPELVQAWMKQGIARGDQKAAFYLGLSYLQPPVQKELARRYLALAALPGETRQAYAENVMRENGMAPATPEERKQLRSLRPTMTKREDNLWRADHEMRKNEPAAREYARAAMAEGSETAGFWLGTWLVDGVSGEKDLAEAIRLLAKAPRERRVWRFALARALWDAEPPDQDRERAQEILAELRQTPYSRYEPPELAAALAKFGTVAPPRAETPEDKELQSRLGDPEAAGDPDYEPDLPQAAVAFQKAKEAGFFQAAAYEPLKEAAELGHVEAMTRFSYLLGCSNCGIQMDLAKAEYWAQKAAATGDPAGKQCLGDFYRDRDPWLARKLYTEIKSTGSLAYLDQRNMGKGPRPANKQRLAAAQQVAQEQARLQAAAMLASQNQPPPATTAPEFPAGAQFRRPGESYIGLQVIGRFGGTYTLLERKPRRGGTYDVNKVKMSPGQLAAYERVATPTPFCTKCGGRGDSFLAKGTADGYDYVPDGKNVRKVHVGTYDGTYKPCTRCEGSGFEN